MREGGKRGGKKSGAARRGEGSGNFPDPSAPGDQGDARDQAARATGYSDLLGDCPERTLFVLAIDRGRGGNNNPEGRNQHTEEEQVNRDNVTVDQTSTSDRQGGNSVSYAIRRLGRERPDLLAS